jgi:F0F1-type ATP synthase assembly protein I
MQPRASGPFGPLGDYGPYLSLGLEFAVTLLVFIFLGHYLDGRWGTGPWLTLTGAVLGFSASFYYLFKTLSNLPGGKRNRDKGAS